jgi:REP element-mobilizing transposase RayT
MPDYPERLTHSIPSWVKGRAIDHIRIRIDSRSPAPLTDPALAPLLLESARIYHQQKRWNCSLFLLMPDHLHALIQFPLEQKMSSVVSAWKRYQTTQHGIHWQTNFFDHRIRHGGELNEKAAYILRNPIVGKLCDADEA